MPLPFRFAGWAWSLALGLMHLLAAQAASPVPAKGSLEFISNQGQWQEQVRYAAALTSGRWLGLPTGLPNAFHYLAALASAAIETTSQGAPLVELPFA